MADDEMDQSEDWGLEPEPEFQRAKSLVLAPEPLFSTLLRDVVARLWPGDAVMADFVTHIAGPLSFYLGHIGAKGGAFVEQRRAEGKRVDERYTFDQSQRAHVINGLFPMLHIARTLKEWGAPQFRYYDDIVRRFFVAGYVLHDYLKLPDVEAQLEAAGFKHDTAVGPAQMSVLEAIFREWCGSLGLDGFLEPVSGVEAVLHDLIYVACNTQTRWGTLRNLSLLPRLSLAAAQLDLTEQLSRLADLLAYVARTPQDVVADRSIRRDLAILSNQTARLICHHLADNRGVLTNFIHNAALAAMSDSRRVPLLYAPSGVVYLEHTKAPPLPDVSTVGEDAIRRVQQVVGQALIDTRDGFQRDGKGIKHAEYYWLFFDLPRFVELGALATFDIIREGKKPSAGKRFEKMQNKDWLGSEVDLDLPDDLRVDQLAEWCYLAEKQVTAKLPKFDTSGFLLQEMGLSGLRELFDAVPRDNRAGGVGYHWYFAAGHYLKRHPGLDPAAWRERIGTMAHRLAQAVQAAGQRAGDDRAAEAAPDDWDDLRAYIARTLTLGSVVAEGDDRTAFALELQRYRSAKRKGRGKTQVCSLCSSAYRVDKQRETAILFAPQVYSNKLSLHGSNAIRDICSICGIEMMLRQLLMNRSAASGGRFEGRRVRYLYFYPTYFFTPETLSLLRRVYVSLKRISFTELRRQLVDETGNVDLTPQTLQRLEPLLLIPDEEVDPASDRYLRLHFPETEPVTFYFMGIPPPGRDAKDAEAWVHPALLALLLPLCLDVKVVASESSLPIILEADEISEMVFLDGPHAAIGYLVGEQMRVNVDQVLPTLQRLIVGYLIHVDANSRMSSSGYDYRWQDLPALARALDQSPLYAFHYLKKWQRQRSLDAIPPAKARQYLMYTAFLKGENGMSHARELTTLYRQFYRARRSNSNSILRPISLAARTVLDADLRLFGQEGLVEAVYGELHSYIERAGREGLAYFPKGSDRQSRERAMRDFAAYFVDQVFYQVFRADKSALRGRQLNLLKSACEVIYRDDAARDWAASDLDTDADRAPAAS